MRPTPNFSTNWIKLVLLYTEITAQILTKFAFAIFLPSLACRAYIIFLPLAKCLPKSSKFRPKTDPALCFGAGLTMRPCL